MSQESDPFKCSDVVYAERDADACREAGATIAVHRLECIDEYTLPECEETVERLHAAGLFVFDYLSLHTFPPRIFEYVMDEPGLLAAACVDFLYNTIPIGWFKYRSFKDRSYRFFCINHPAFQRFIHELLYLHLKAGVDGIIVDDCSGTVFSMPHGGCFCPYCVRKFREYLRAKHDADRLRAFGIENVDTFDYREYVKQYANDTRTYIAEYQKGGIPLKEEHRKFVYFNDAEFVRELKDIACKLKGAYVPFGFDNVSFGVMRAPNYPQLDHFDAETVFSFGDAGLEPDNVFYFKIAEALGKPYTPTPSIGNWAAIRAGTLTGLLKLLVALSYANGANLRFPYRGWCKDEDSDEPGRDRSRWYYPPREPFLPFYRFVREHAELFDGYAAVAQLGVVYSERAHYERTHYASLRAISGKLVDMGVPFVYLLAGQELLDADLDQTQVEGLDCVLVPDDSRLSPAQDALVDEWVEAGTAVRVADAGAAEAVVGKKLGPVVSVQSPGRAWVFARHNPSEPGTPLVCHVLNGDYDLADLEDRTQKDVALSLDMARLDRPGPYKLTAHAPDAAPVELEHTEADGRLRITIPEVRLWHVVSIASAEDDGS